MSSDIIVQRSMSSLSENIALMVIDNIKGQL